MLKLNYRGVLTGTLLAACSLLAALAPALAEDKSAALFADPVVAKGKGFEIKQSKLQDEFILMKASMAARGRPVLESERPLLESNLLQRVILTEILKGKATDADKATAKADTEKYIAKAKEYYKDMFDTEVKASGMSLDQFTQRAIEQNTCEVVLERELKSKITVADDAVKKYYDEHPADFKEPEQVRASHILLSTVDKSINAPFPPEKKKAKEKLIKELKERAEKGEDFAKLAKEYSEDPGSKDKGGEYTFGRGQMVKEFEAAAFSLKTNQISDVVETQYGYHIIKLSEKIPAKPISFVDVAARIKNGLINRELDKQLPAYVEKLKAEASVQLIDRKAKTAASAAK